MDEEVTIDVTFWEHVEVGQANAAVNLYKNSITLNTGQSSSMKINPKGGSSSLVVYYFKPGCMQSYNLSEIVDASSTNSFSDIHICT